MTSYADEIRALRAGLDHIVEWCYHTALHTPSDVERANCNHIATLARRTLKTPRASKLLPPSGDTDLYP